MSVNPVTLHIEKLVVDGFAMAPAEAAQLKSTIERELTRLLVNDHRVGDRIGADPKGRAMPWLAAPTIHLAPSLSAPEMGRRVARSVYRSLAGAGLAGVGLAGRDQVRPSRAPISSNPNPGERA